MIIRYNGEFCNLLTTIADEDNFAVAIALLKKGPLSLSELQKEVTINKNSLVKHLDELLECSYVFSKKSGRDKIFYINKGIIVPILSIMSSHIKKHHIKPRH